MSAWPRGGCRGMVLLSTMLVTPAAWAEAKFVINILDNAGEGFNDTTPATPVGGNNGTTVGEQRLIAFQAGADAWGRVLDSPVPIVVEATFGPLECTNGMALAGQAGPYMVSDRAGLEAGIVYPTALANRIVGKDMFPTYADISAKFNGGLFDCMGIDWYYGLDGLVGENQSNLMGVVIHELTHGLGFSDGADADTGEFRNDLPPGFGSFMLDLTTGKHWSEMTPSERKASMVNVRRLAWDGERTQAVASRFLAKGLPSIQVTPPLSGFSGVVGEANFGRLVADGPSISGSVANLTISSTCTVNTTGVSGKIALVISPGNCGSLSAAYYVEQAGALAMVYAYDLVGSPPPRGLESRNDKVAQWGVTIPTLALTIDDAKLLKNASSISLTLSADKTQYVGTDDAGHPLLFASNPIQGASTGSHWDPMVRPNLIMEPVERPNVMLYLDMERAAMWDIGWIGNCGNGAIDDQEECDKGDANSDFLADACRLDCTKAKCGDGVVDSGEQCDPGGRGSVANPKCGTDCRPKATGGTGGAGGGVGGNGSGGASVKGGAGGGAAGGAGGSGVGGNGSGGASVKGGAGGGAAGGSGGSGGSAGSGGGSGGTSSKGGSSGSGGQSSTNGGSGGTSGTTQGGGTKGGCSCRIDRHDGSSSIAWLIAGFGVAIVLSRQNRWRATSRGND